MFSGQIPFYADNCVAGDRLVTEYEKLTTLVSFVVGKAVLMVKLFSVRIMNSLLAVYRDTDNFTLARTFKTVWFSTLLTDVV